VRLANLIGVHEGRFAPLATALEEARETSVKLISRLSDAERTVEETRRSAQDFNDNWKPILTEVSRRLGPLTERLTVLNNSVLKAEAGLQALNSDQSEMRETVATLSDQMSRSRTESGRQLEAWQTTIDEHKDTIERFTQQWLTLSNQYKEARMAVQNFAHWQKQLEQQKREASEMLRIESNRMQSRWDGFLLEIQEKLKNFELELSQKWQAFELENEQKWAGARRNEQVWREEMGAIDELIQKLQQDNRNLIWRVQAAQADAIKKWPRLLMEEVEKAVELNPNRRLSSSGASARSDMSVVDAIEKGLIKIDYSDDASL
jgi:chromosome segregation ATPase